MAPLKFVAVVTVIALIFMPCTTQAQLSTGFYQVTCPELQTTVQTAFFEALRADARIGASLTRMYFHDCFVQGCDGSILLENTATFTGEQGAVPNLNSLRGYNVVNSIKAAVENVCPDTVSCADLLALIAFYGVTTAGGPPWPVEFGRRDSTTACFSCANQQIPSPSFTVAELTQSFANKGLSQKDMVALAGAHTFGKAHCAAIGNRLYPTVDPTLNSGYAKVLERQCPNPVSNEPNTVVSLDVTSDQAFDNAYFTNLVAGFGLLASDETLQSEGGATATLVEEYAALPTTFFNQFASSIVKMGQISPLTGTRGQIRKNCAVVNS